MTRLSRGRALLGGMLLLGCLASASACEGQRGRAPDAGTVTARRARADSALLTGKYDSAIVLLTALSAEPAAAAADRRALLRALATVGRYEEAERAGRQFASAERQGVDLWNALGEVLYQRGELAAADSAFTKAIAGHASNSLTAQVNAAILRDDRGDRAEAMRRFQHVVDIYQAGAGPLSSEELAAVGTACRYLGSEDPERFKDALRAYDAAVAADSGNLDARVRLGDLFLEKYNSPDAAATFAAVLKVNPSEPRALLGMARRLRFDGAPGAAALAARALAVNPSFPEAHSFVAALELDLEDDSGAAAEAERALAVNPASREALAVLAAARFLQGDTAGYEAARGRALTRNPKDAELYATLADLSARSRLYRQAADFARQATVLDPRSSHAFSLLGMNQLRLGQMAEGRHSLETAFAADPYDVWTKNTLDLLDTFSDYTVTDSGRFRLVIDKKESALLSLYMLPLLEEAYDSLAARYDYRPATPVRLEVYRSHADFSVRTIGLAGLGALGVSFGNVLAMDSPAARDGGDFNWGSTAWHELVHAFTLGVSEHRVPRWLSEGLSVYEERRARPAWGADVTPGFLTAYASGHLPPVSRLNDGFMHPAYPEQVIFSYYEASLVCELIEHDFGQHAITEMLRGYRDGLGTADVFRRVLHSEPADFDRRFDVYVRQRFAAPLAALRSAIASAAQGGNASPPAHGLPERAAGVPDDSDFIAQLSTGRALFDAKKHAEAEPYLERARALFPEYAGSDSPYWYLALIHRERGALRQAAAELTRLTARNEDDYAANLLLDTLLETLGDSAGAAAALDRAMYISPYDPATHARLAALYAGLGDHARSIRERRAVVALDPVDRAEALYQLALAYHEAGDRRAARRELLHALEDAPNFQKAQELLLTLERESGGTGPGARRP